MLFFAIQLLTLPFSPSSQRFSWWHTVTTFQGTSVLYFASCLLSIVKKIFYLLVRRSHIRTLFVIEIFWAQHLVQILGLLTGQQDETLEVLPEHTRGCWWFGGNTNLYRVTDDKDNEKSSQYLSRFRWNSDYWIKWSFNSKNGLSCSRPHFTPISKTNKQTYNILKFHLFDGVCERIFNRLR